MSAPFGRWRWIGIGETGGDDGLGNEAKVGEEGRLVVWLLENWKSSLAVSISEIYMYIYICFRKLKVEERWIDDRSMMELRDKLWNWE